MYVQRSFKSYIKNHLSYRNTQQEDEHPGKINKGYYSPVSFHNKDHEGRKKVLGHFAMMKNFSPLLLSSL